MASDEEQLIRYPDYRHQHMFGEYIQLGDEERKALFNAAVEDYLRDNLSIDVDKETGWYDSLTVTVTISLKLGDRVISRNDVYI